MNTNFKNELAPAVIELNRMNEELQAENEKLKGELKQTEAQDQVVIDGLRNENAKLKCLALHAMSYAVVSLTSNTNKFKPFRLFVKYNDAYRKAKMALREGK